MFVENVISSYSSPSVSGISFTIDGYRPLVYRSGSLCKPKRDVNQSAMKIYQCLFIIISCHLLVCTAVHLRLSLHYTHCIHTHYCCDNNNCAMHELFACFAFLYVRSVYVHTSYGRSGRRILPRRLSVYLCAERLTVMQEQQDSAAGRGHRTST